MSKHLHFPEFSNSKMYNVKCYNRTVKCNYFTLGAFDRCLIEKSDRS